jgi:hypothetical protein
VVVWHRGSVAAGDVAAGVLVCDVGRRGTVAASDVASGVDRVVVSWMDGGDAALWQPVCVWLSCKCSPVEVISRKKEERKKETHTWGSSLRAPASSFLCLLHQLPLS